MLTDAERYQLQWMIKHGHSLKELMDELTYYQNDLAIGGVENLSVRKVFDEWSNELGIINFKTAAALEYDNGAFYDSERGILIASFMTDYDDPTIEVFKATVADLREITSKLTEADIEYGQTTHELAGDNCEHIGTFRSVAELRGVGYLDSDFIDVSDTRALVDVVSRLTLEDNSKQGEQSLDEICAAKSDEADFVAGDLDGDRDNKEVAHEHGE